MFVSVVAKLIIKESELKRLVVEIVNDRSGYLRWKRKNVTIRGINDNKSDDLGGMAKYGQGLYTAFLSNREMAREYGSVYYVVNAIPQKPKITYNVNEAEMFLQKLVTDFCKINGVPRDNYFFSDKTTIGEEMAKLGYDGLIIKGREMVNYNPPDGVKYFKTEKELENYYQVLKVNNLITESYVEDPYLKDNDIWDYEPTQKELSDYNKTDYVRYIPNKTSNSNIQTKQPIVVDKPVKITKNRGDNPFNPKVKYTGKARLVHRENGKVVVDDEGIIKLMKHKLNKLIEENPKNKKYYWVQFEFEN